MLFDLVLRCEGNRTWAEVNEGPVGSQSRPDRGESRAEGRFLVLSAKQGQNRALILIPDFKPAGNREKIQNYIRMYICNIF